MSTPALSPVPVVRRDEQFPGQVWLDLRATPQTDDQRITVTKVRWLEQITDEDYNGEQRLLSADGFSSGRRGRRRAEQP